MKMFMLVEVILSKKSVNPETGKVVYQSFFNNAKKVMGEDGKEAFLPDTGKVQAACPAWRCHEQGIRDRLIFISRGLKPKARCLS